MLLYLVFLIIIIIFCCFFSFGQVCLIIIRAVYYVALRALEFESLKLA